MTENSVVQNILVSAVVFRQDLYPRTKPDPRKIQEYSENLNVLPPIEVNQDYILIDGYHRWKAHETAKAETIPVKITTTGSERELEQLAVKRNAEHGLILSQDDKRKYAARWYGDLTEAEICRILSISHGSYLAWTKTVAEQKAKEQEQAIWDLWLACQTQEAIAEQLGVVQKTVSNKIEDFSKKVNSDDFTIFRNFEDDESEKSGRRVYNLWNFAKATNEVRHFGNIPPEIIDNLLYLYTKPLDIVFDPFGGGGSTIDKCMERKRRYYVSDLTPIPARSDIRQHDITTGLPDDLPVPDLVFLDPPYWKQAEEKYSDKPTDLGNVELEAFLTTLADIAKAVKRKWSNAKRPSGTLALIIGPWKQEGAYLDLALLCYERLSKYLSLKQRVIVPYSTQVHGGAYVKQAKEKKELLYLYRDLLIFGYQNGGEK